MAYVSGFDYDLFFSYAPVDSAEWIDALEESLRRDLIEQLGVPDLAIWRDKDNTRFGQDWREDIQDSIKGSAAFVAIVSPNYRQSEWCARERQVFLDHCNSEGQLKAGKHYRFLKLVRLPWPDNTLEQFYSELPQVNFFERGRRSDEEIEFIPGTSEFRAKVREAGQAIKSLLFEMRRGREAVFIGSTEDTVEAAGELRRELRAQAYAVRPEGPLDEGHSDELIEKEMQPAVLNVHLLGAAYDPFTERLIDLAIKLEKHVAFWLTPEAEESRDVRQRQLISQIRLGRKAPGEWALLHNRSTRAVIQDILGMLRPKPAAASATSNGNSPRVYLLCDPRTPEDAERAREIQTQIREKENMQVDLPAVAAPGVMRADLHQRMLRECDGLLLYRKAAPEGWLFEMFRDVVFAERIVKRPPVRSKALLVNDPSLLQGIPGVPIIPQGEAFQLSDLEPFLAPLREREAYAVD